MLTHSWLHHATGFGFAAVLLGLFGWQYVEAACEAVLKYTGLLPHVNAGVMGEQDMLRYVRYRIASRNLVAWLSTCRRARQHDGCLPQRSTASALGCQQRILWVLVRFCLI